jgi:hypothetical protein
MAILLLSAVSASLVGQIRQQQELVESRAALALLTSTETENVPLVRVAANLPADAHGHWFYRAGVATQVVVGERLPQPARGEHYVVWMLLPSGWTSVGTLPVDETGYGRLVLLGRDGAEAQALEITLETQTSATPGPRVVLRSQSSGS